MRPAYGFNLVELVLVIVIISALAVFAFPRINPGAFDRYAFREELIGAAQYAQKIALASGCAVRFAVDTNGYSLHYRSGGGETGCGDTANPFGDPVPSPNGGDYASSNAAGVTGGATVIFKPQGRPDTGASITFDDGHDVFIEAETGYVHQ